MLHRPDSERSLSAQLFDEGKLGDAMSAAVAMVRDNPTDTAARGFFCELLCFAGEIERADGQLDALVETDPEVKMGVALFRQLLRAEQIRQSCFASGEPPEFIEDPDAELKQRLRGAMLLREGDTASSLAAYQEADGAHVAVSGTCNGKSFRDFRDVDDRTASFLEVLTSNGKYFWVPWSRVQSLTLEEPRYPRDLIWRSAMITVAGGPDGQVYIPTLYPGTATRGDDEQRLGRVTDWSEDEKAPLQGLGQRLFMVDDEYVTIMDLKELTFDSELAG